MTSRESSVNSIDKGEIINDEFEVAGTKSVCAQNKSIYLASQARALPVLLIAPPGIAVF